MGNRQETLEVMAFVRAYESLAWDVCKIPTNWRLDDSPKGKSNYAKFKRILDRLKQEEINPDDFLTVIFHQYKWPRTMSGVTFNHPYLPFLNSSSAIQMYRQSRALIERAIASPVVAQNFIKAKYAKSCESAFKNCFYGGFPVIFHSVADNGLEYYADVWDLFAVFMAFMDIFTPEFVYFHSRYHEVLDANSDGLEPDHKELKALILAYTEPVNITIHRMPSRMLHYRKAREVMAAREKLRVEKFLVSSKDSSWRESWNLLI